MKLFPAAPSDPSLGVILLVHSSLARAAQVARHWAESGCPLVIHVDKAVSAQEHAEFRRALAGLPDILFAPRLRCEWGKWSIVRATQAAAEIMLESFPEVRHVFLASGSCLPLRPLADLRAYLERRPQTDFIESANVEEVPWIVGGLGQERFTLRFPFAWKKQRRLFDAHVRLQRRLGYCRRIPEGIVPHIGSQWWCLTRRTLTAILEDPRRREYDRYFSRVWIPDESYFQTMARLHARRLESRSLTLAKFDHQGKPHMFYDDHLQLLIRSKCFVARKIWPKADLLYNTFLQTRESQPCPSEPNPNPIDKLFASARERRVRGRTGLYMQSRFPAPGRENGLTCAPYSVFEGFSDLFTDFETWLSRTTGARVHGHLFARHGAEFEGGQDVFAGGLSSSAAVRDRNPRLFLASLIWNMRGEHQAFQYGPDDSPEAGHLIAQDPNARISVITGAWAIPLFHSSLNFNVIRKIAALRQRAEAAHVDLLRSHATRARVRIWSLAEFMENPMENLQIIADTISPRAMRKLTEAPRLANLAGFGKFLQDLKNHGMHPYMMGNFPPDNIQPIRLRPSGARPRIMK